MIYFPALTEPVVTIITALIATALWFGIQRFVRIRSMIYSPALPATLALLGLAYWQFGIGGVIVIVIAALLFAGFGDDRSF